MRKEKAPKRKGELIIVFALSGLFHKFSCYGLLFPVKDCGGLLIVFTLFKFTNNTFFFYEPLETLNCFFQHLVIIYNDMSQMNSPPSFLGRKIQRYDPNNGIVGLAVRKQLSFTKLT